MSILDAVKRWPHWATPDGSAVLVNGDCREILPGLPRVDAIIADIPYGEVNRESGGLRNLDKDAADVETFPLSFVIEHCSRLASSAYVWCGTEQVSELRAGFVEQGMTTRMCGWEKTNPSPMNGEYLWLSSFECCVFARHAKAYFGEHCASPIWRGPICRNQVHPTQKPTWLIRKQVEASVPKGKTCIDFCMGSGTTGIACLRTNRRFIGIEKEPKYFEIAVRRLEAELNRHPLFEEPAKIQQELAIA